MYSHATLRCEGLGWSEPGDGIVMEYLSRMQLRRNSDFRVERKVLRSLGSISSTKRVAPQSWRTTKSGKRRFIGLVAGLTLIMPIKPWMLHTWRVCGGGFHNCMRRGSSIKAGK